MNDEIAFDYQYTSLWHQQEDSAIDDYKPPLEGKKQAPIGQERQIIQNDKNFSSIIDPKIDFLSFSHNSFHSLPSQTNTTTSFLSYNRSNEQESSENFMIQFRGGHSSNFRFD